MSYFVPVKCLNCGKTFKIIVDGKPPRHEPCWYCGSDNTVIRSVKVVDGRKFFYWDIILVLFKFFLKA